MHHLWRHSAHPSRVFSMSLLPVRSLETFCSSQQGLLLVPFARTISGNILLLATCSSYPVCSTQDCASWSWNNSLTFHLFSRTFSHLKTAHFSHTGAGSPSE